MTTSSGDGDEAIVNHVGLCVTDLDRSRHFYQDVLGFVSVRELTVPDAAAGPLLSIDAPVELTAVYLERGSFVLELLHFGRPENPPAAPRPFNQPGLTHLSFSVPDLEACVALVPGAGGTVVTQFGRAAAIIRDPDGQLLELLPPSYRRNLNKPPADT